MKYLLQNRQKHILAKLWIACFAVSFCLFTLRPLVAQPDQQDQLQPPASGPLGTLWTSYQEVPVSGESSRNAAAVDEMMVKFLVDHQIPGATLAITKNSQLVYARGFGFSDLENRIPMQPDTPMRLASVSKPLTGVAILQLIDAGKLGLHDQVFPNLRFKTVDGKAPIDPRMNEITILQLLRHTAGFDRKKSFDPMFVERKVAEHVGREIPVDPEDIITYMLSRELDFDPGDRYAYSNFGYSVLGRVIEEISGQSYEDYVKENVLKPVGVQGMAIGKTRVEDRLPGETRYYTRQGNLVSSLIDQDKKRVLRPYGRWSVPTMDAHGGWVGSAIDLVAFASAFDRPDRCPILSQDAVAAMYRPPGLEETTADRNGARRFYACGWNVVVLPDGRKFNCFHSGLLDGTSTMLVRRHDGFNWAVLFNVDRTLDNSFPAGKIDPLIHKAINATQRWR